MKYDVIIVGAGAAGLFCAIESANRGRRTLVIEHNGEVGRKILISGGGRCNFTNRQISPNNFLSRNPHFCKSALARYTERDFIEMVKRHNIQFYEKKLGQLFCTESSRQIVQMLLRECEKAKVEIRLNCSVARVTRSRLFHVETNQGNFETRSLVIATGGLSFPKIGASDFGYTIARQFGLQIVETRPSLVPLIFADMNLSKLAGISIDSIVRCGKGEFRENILFTHRGLSGPAVLQISNYWQKERNVSINLVPDVDVRQMLLDNRHRKQNLDNFLSRFVPNRFAEIFVNNNRPLNQTGMKELDKLADRLNNWQVQFKETEGYDRAEVTLGGVSTDELSSQTMESKRVEGLFFVGEIIDVTGWLGGYNFQWAWSSGYAAGQSV